jgi:hypothetical protein
VRQEPQRHRASPPPAPRRREEEKTSIKARELKLACGYQVTTTTMRTLFRCFVGSEPAASGSETMSGDDEGRAPPAATTAKTKTKTKKKSVRRMASATARLRSLSLDDLSRALATSGLHVFTLAELKAATRNFSSSHFIGEGGFGPVYKGFLDGRVRPGELEPQHVAVKYLDADGPQGHREWLAEVVYLGMLSHPHLVKLVGYGCQDDQRMLVYEYMARGSLEHHLFKSKRTKPSYIPACCYDRSPLCIYAWSIDDLEMIEMCGY